MDPGWPNDLPSVRLLHLPDHLGADLPDIHPILKAGEVIKKQELLVLHSDGTHHVVIQYVGFEILGQTARVDDLFPGLLNVLHDVRHGGSHFCTVTDGFHIATPEAFVEVRVLDRHLTAVGVEVIVFLLIENPRHGSLGDIENAVKMKAAGLGGSLPYPCILPPLTGAKAVKADREPLTEGILGMQTPIVGEGAEIIELM